MINTNEDRNYLVKEDIEGSITLPLSIIIDPDASNYLRVLALLVDRGSLSTSQIGKQLNISKDATLRALKKLKQKQLIYWHRKNKEYAYTSFNYY